MHKSLLIGFLLAAALGVQAANTLPDIGDARIVVLANNLQNYYINYDESSRPSYHNEDGLVLKTQRIADMMIESEADIFAFCEVEAKPVALEYLVAALNERVGGDAFAYVEDGINVATDSYDNAIKSGFVYRKASVEPYGNNYQAANAAYYKNTMRIQAWTELETGERFTLSMNHFKAKSDSASMAQRVKNANWLMSALSSTNKVKDPDILLMGDLNAQMGEQAMAVIVKSGYEEQLLHFDSTAYSYVYYGKQELIDHAFANPSMASQITGAAVWHTNTSVAYADRYSDHDAVLVGLRLGDDQGFESVSVSEPHVQKILRHGQLFIIRGGELFTITGQRVY